MNKKQFFSAPFLVFMLCGTIIPLGVIALYGLTDRSGAFTIENITAITTAEHMEALVLSLGLAFISTVICLIIAFPLGLILRDSGLGKKGFIVFVFILPMWMNFLLRTMAWQVLLEKNGVINNVLDMIGLPALEIIKTWQAIKSISETHIRIIQKQATPGCGQVHPKALRHFPIILQEHG